MPYVYPINFFASSISKELQKVASQSAMLGQEAATNKRSISSIPSANIIISAIEHNQLTSISCAIASIVSAVEYLQIAKSGLQEQQTLLHSTLNLVTQVITDPSLQTLSNLAIVNNQLQTQIQQVQKIVDTTQDVNGIEILSNTSFSFTPGAAVPLQYLINNTGNTIGQASFANATPAVVNAAIIANLAGLGITDASARTLVAQNLTNAANIATAHTGTVAEYLYYAIYMIPTIAIPPSQVQQYFNDAIRAEQLIALLPQVLVDSGLYSGVPLTGLNPPSTIQNYGSNVVAAMTNTSIPNNHGNAFARGWGFNDAGTPPNTPASIAFANLLTVAEKNALIADSSSTFINAIYGSDYTLNHYQGASPIAKFLVYITSFINIDPNGTTILDLSNIEGPPLTPHGIIDNIVDITAGAAASATDTAARYTAMQALIYNRANPQIVINSYPLTAALNIINTTSPSTQPVAQIGANPSDRLPLQINNTSTAGLNLNAINIATLPYAYIAQTYLQDALQFIASTINNINSQVTQLNARTNTIKTQIDLLQDQIDAIENTDLTANATALADAKITVIIAGALMKLDATLKTTISASARKILIRPRG